LAAIVAAVVAVAGIVAIGAVVVKEEVAVSSFSANPWILKARPFKAGPYTHHDAA
jgi:hypothetical protein